MSALSITACIPCFNGAATLAEAINGITSQTVVCAEILVIDDGSTDESAKIGASCGARVLRNVRNLGRGASRARAMVETSCDYVLFCDAGIALAPEFIDRALRHFPDAGAAGTAPVAGVFGRFIRSGEKTAIERWEGRHLFRSARPRTLESRVILVTGGALLNRRATLSVGNFNAQLREGEDADLGARLLGAGFDVRYDPALEARPLVSDNLKRALERYARWNTKPGATHSLRDYVRLAAYGAKVMAFSDLRHADPRSAMISLIAPHYQFWRARFRKNQHG